MDQERPTPGQEFDLALILNILWRRRWIVLGLPALGLVLGLLYGAFGTRRWEARANIRPGITAYDEAGGAHRQWQLKDITRFYDQMLYRKELVKRLGLPSASRIVIRTEYVAQGLTNLDGGDVITLWTTATSPELAAAIIDTSLALFNEYAEADTVSSQLKLTRDGLELQIRNYRNRLLAVDKQEAGLALRFQAARAESLMVAVLDQELGIDLEMLGSREKLCKERIVGLQGEVPRLAADLEELDTVLGRTTAGQDAGEVAAARLLVQQALAHNLAQQDSLAYTLEVTSLDVTKRRVQRRATVATQLREIERKIGDLTLERDFDLPAQRADLQNEIEGRRRKLALLSPLQRVGGTQTSDDPVRPRTRRATLILVFLGALGGLVLAFVVDYLLGHRREIFRT